MLRLSEAVGVKADPTAIEVMTPRTVGQHLAFDEVVNSAEVVAGALVRSQGRLTRPLAVNRALRQLVT